MYCCGYPIKHTVSVDESGRGEYEVTLNGEVVYEGVVQTPNGGAGEVEVDLSDIFSEYLDTNFEDFDNLSGTSDKAVKTFSVDGTSYQVAYNYNTDYVLEIENGAVVNFPVTYDVDPRMYIGQSIMSDSGISATHNRMSGSPGTIIKIGNYDFRLTKECKNRYALYYVNEYGGIDYLLCSGKVVDKYNTKRTEAKLYADMSDRKTFSTKRIYQDVSKRYELNTGWMQDDRAANIHHLIYSPKIWIHSLETDTITACNIDDTAYTIRNYKNDKLLNYTINLTESKTLKRR